MGTEQFELFLETDSNTAGWPRPREARLVRMSRSPRGRVREHAILHLARRIRSASPMERTRLLAEWALLDSARARETLLRALPKRTHLLGEATVLEHLAEDESARVRAAVAESIGARLHHHPQRYQRILDRLIEDSRQRVRRQATRASERA